MLVLFTCLPFSDYAAPAPWRWVLATIIPVFIAWWGLKRKSLNTSGAAAGIFILIKYFITFVFNFQFSR